MNKIYCVLGWARSSSQSRSWARPSTISRRRGSGVRARGRDPGVRGRLHPGHLAWARRRRGSLIFCPLPILTVSTPPPPRCPLPWPRPQIRGTRRLLPRPASKSKKCQPPLWNWNLRKNCRMKTRMQLCQRGDGRRRKILKHPSFATFKSLNLHSRVIGGLCKLWCELNLSKFGLNSPLSEFLVSVTHFWILQSSLKINHFKIGRYIYKGILFV